MGLYLPKGVEQAACEVALAYLNIVFLPIDVEFPVKIVEHCVSAIGLRMILTDTKEHLLDMPGKISYGLTQTPQVWLDYQVSEIAGKLYLNWDVLRGKYDDGVIAQMFSCYLDSLEKMTDIYIDPFGANYLEQEIRKANVPGTFILSCGCFPGFTGLAMKYLCDSYESVNSISGICIDRQIPGVNGIIDFIISGLKGFGETSYYYYAGNKKYDDKQENFRDYDGKEVEIQKYFTTEIADVINKFSPRKAIWYTPALGREITEIMQKAVVGYIQTEQYTSIFTYAQKIQKLIEEKSRGECETGCEINIWSSGLSGGKQRERSIVIKSSFGSSLTAAVLDTVTAKIMEKGLTPGIYYATDIISMLDVIKQNVNREINYYCNDESINIGTEGIVYEEGIL